MVRHSEVDISRLAADTDVASFANSLPRLPSELDITTAAYNCYFILFSLSPFASSHVLQHSMRSSGSPHTVPYMTLVHSLCMHTALQALYVRTNVHMYCNWHDHMMFKNCTCTAQIWVKGQMQRGFQRTYSDGGTDVARSAFFHIWHTISIVDSQEIDN